MPEAEHVARKSAAAKALDRSAEAGTDCVPRTSKSLCYFDPLHATYRGEVADLM